MAIGTGALGQYAIFTSLAGSPPQAAYVDVVGRFLVLSGLTSNPYRVQWSGLNSINTSSSWTSGVNSSDFQDLPDGGLVRGVAGGAYGGGGGGLEICTHLRCTRTKR